MTSTPSLDVSAARALIAADPDVLVVDVRTPGEYATCHIPGAVNLPLDQIDAHLNRIVADAGGQLLLVCQVGGRAAQARARLTGAGLEGSTILAGGMNAWNAAGGPTSGADDGGRPRWSLERQVRLVAGSLVSSSVLAGVWWPPAGYLAGFIGAGLTFAAITDTCAMGMALARLPYNRGPRFDAEATLLRLRGGRPDGRATS
ncbi:rhodanese-like domain-containing protein [Streptosporangium sp. NPDC049078]|uniref:rhodanese-like domain-containing protein n=1 Tax=Streptosporangium sp. NPDC049078 TaxID=3155767 RepID=UPI00341AA3C8